MSYVLLASEFFKAIGEIASLVPTFSERRKKELAKEIKNLSDLEKSFNDLAVSFQIGSSSRELLGMADAVNTQEKKLKDLIGLYAKELKS